MPLRKFKDVSSYETRALQIWQILISKAHNRQIITYKQLSELIGYRGAGVLAQTLGHILHYCKLYKLPPLTSLVVAEKTGLPGSGIGIKKDLHSLREKVFKYDWYGLYPPTPEELSKIYYKSL
jgi:hypothetical protein